MKNEQKQTLSKSSEEREEMKTLVKAVYKSVLKTLREKNAKNSAQKVVDDLLDPNYVAEVDPDEIPTKKDKVMYKGSKSAKSREKGVKKLKRMCKKIKSKKVCKDEPIPGLDQN